MSLLHCDALNKVLQLLLTATLPSHFLSLLCLHLYCCPRMTQPATVMTMGLTISTMLAAPLATGLMTIQAGGLKGWQVGTQLAGTFECKCEVMVWWWSMCLVCPLQ